MMKETMNNPVITIAIPVFNAEKYIEASIETAINQTFSDYEILIIDNASTDNTLRIIENKIHENKGKNIRIIRHPENLGLGASKNTAIDNARGKYLYFMDADDEIYPDALEALYKTSQKYPDAEIVSGSVEVYINGLLDHYVQGENRYVEGKYAAVSPYFIIPDWNRLYLVSFLKGKNIRCIPHHLHEDVLFSFQLICLATKVAYVNNITYKYLVRVDSVCSSENARFTDKAADEQIEICKFEYEYITKNKNYDNIHNKLMFLIQYSNVICKLLEKPRLLTSEERLLQLHNYRIALRFSEFIKLPVRLRVFVIGAMIFPFRINCWCYNWLMKYVFKRK